MEKSPGPVELTIVMPALNEEANIARAIQRTLGSFDRFGVKGEVVVVNDGSTDSTPQRVEELMARGGEGRLRTIRHATPQGVGASFRDGARAAKGEAVAFLPGDDENDPAEIVRYLPLLKDVDLIVPFVYNRGVRALSRNLLSRCYRTIINLSFAVNFNYTNGTVLYRRCILDACPNRSDGFFFQTENVIRAAKAGYLFAEVPYRLDVRRGGGSKAISLKSLKAVIRDYLRLLAEVYGPGGSQGAISPESATIRRRTEAGEPSAGSRTL